MWNTLNMTIEMALALLTSEHPEFTGPEEQGEFRVWTFGDTQLGLHIPSGKVAWRKTPATFYLTEGMGEARFLVRKMAPGEEMEVIFPETFSSKEGVCKVTATRGKLVDIEVHLENGETYLIGLTVKYHSLRRVTPKGV